MPATGNRIARRMYALKPCERCGKAGVHRHHKDDNPNNNDANNIEVLCASCHKARHRSYHLFTDTEVLIIRYAVADGRATQAQLARQCNVSRQTINFIVSGISYPYVGGPRHTTHHITNVQHKLVHVTYSEHPEWTLALVAAHCGMSTETVRKILREAPPE
jgi:DNA-binding CsgD family transcriptional regulator